MNKLIMFSCLVGLTFAEASLASILEEASVPKDLIQFSGHVRSGYKVGLREVTVESGITINRETNEKECDFRRETINVLLSYKSGVYKFYKKKSGNHYCNPYVEESVFITTDEIMDKEFIGFTSMLKNQNIELSWNNETKVFSVKGEEVDEVIDLSDAFTADSFEALVSKSGRSRSGNFQTNYSIESFNTEVISDLPNIEGLKVCDARKDSDPNDDSLNMTEICE